MRPRVKARSRNPGEVLRYLFGPGDDGEHHGHRLVAAWAGSAVGGLASLQPARQPGGGFSVLRLATLLDQPVLAGVRPPYRPVWHCGLHLHPADPLLSDGQWVQIATEFVDALELAPAGDADAVRWVAVRHGDDHIHIVATLVRQDGRTVWLRRDYLRCQAITRRLERELGLHQTGVPVLAREAGP